MSKLASGCQPYSLPKDECLAYNRVEWGIVPDRAVLLIHDMQRYYLRPLMTGSEGPGRELIANIKTVKAACVSADIPAIYTVCHPCKQVEQRGLLNDFWGPGMTDRVENVDVVDGLTPLEKDYVVVKHKYSAFYMSSLLDTLRLLKRDQLIITGVYSHIGCLATALDALMRDIKVFYMADAVGDFSLDFHMSSLSTVGNCCGQIFLTQQLVNGLSAKRMQEPVVAV
jgi:bifunctional isochorismate lyase / aryl carrier protein